RVGFLTAAANLEIGDLYRAQIFDDDARAGASIDDGAAVPVRSDLDIVRRAVGAEVDGAAVHHAPFQKEPIARGEGVLGHASGGGPARPPGGAISSVVAVPADVIGLAGNSAGRRRGQHDDHACGQKTRSKLSSHATKTMAGWVDGNAKNPEFLCATILFHCETGLPSQGDIGPPLVRSSRFLAALSKALMWLRLLAILYWSFAFI